MTPKEKADELYVGYWYLTNDSRIAKKCALIAIDEILNAIDWHEFEVPNDQLEHWLEVQKEIEKL